MRNLYFSSLILAVLSTLPLVSQAAPVTPMPLVSEEVQGQSAVRAGKINLNTADVVVLQRELLGIGEAKARAIVAYREENGAFASVDELLEVKGIGKAILERNRDKLDIN
ncbi:ComEA family DNA-binding protein [Pseudomonas sp. B11]